MKKIIAIGEIIIDMIGTQNAKSIEETASFEPFVGGSPANFIHYLNLFKNPAFLVATVGNDDFGQKAIKYLSENQMNTDLIRQESTHPTSVIFINKSESSPRFISYRGADAYLLSEQLREIDIHNCQLIHTTAFALSKNPAQENILQFLGEHHNEQVIYSIDFNFSPKIWHDNEKNAQEILRKFAEWGAYIKVSREDVERLFGKMMGPEEFINRYLKLGAQVVCYTDGGNGAYAASPTQPITFQAAEPIKVVDSTGAGDSFWAAFVHSYLNNLSIAQALDYGNTIASKKLQITGPLQRID